jgi:hypothetical protein
VNYSYTIEELKPFGIGDFYTAWRVNPGVLVRRSRLMLGTPAALHLRTMLARSDRTVSGP